MDNSNIEIKLDNVGMVYQADNHEVTALTGVSLRIAADLLKPTSGEVLIGREYSPDCKTEPKVL